MLTVKGIGGFGATGHAVGEPRIGNTFAHVTPVGEPAALAVFGAAAAGPAYARRRSH